MLKIQISDSAFIRDGIFALHTEVQTSIDSKNYPIGYQNHGWAGLEPAPTLC